MIGFLIGVLAEIANVTKRTIDHYTNIGLLEVNVLLLITVIMINLQLSVYTLLNNVKRMVCH